MSERERWYEVEFERVDVWAVEVAARNRRAAVEIVRRSEFDIEDQIFAYHAGQGRVRRVERCSS